MTIVISAAAYYFISNYPHNSNFLSEDEKALVHARLKADSDSVRDEGFNWRNVSKALFDPKCWLYGAAFHTMSLPLYTLSLFLVRLVFLVESP